MKKTSFKMKKFLILFFAFIVLFAGLAPALAEKENLALNPSFEEDDNGRPMFWNTWDWKNDRSVTSYHIETGEAHSGEKFATIVNDKENDARFRQLINVKENSMYRISCWVKTENVGFTGLGANISITGRLETSRDVKGTTDGWESIELYVKTGRGINTLDITLGLGGYGYVNTGKASFDDVLVEEVNAIPAGVPMAVIEGTGGEKEKDGGESVTGEKDGTRSFRSDWMIYLGAFFAALAGAGYAFCTRKDRQYNPEKVYEGDYFPDEEDDSETNGKHEKGDKLKSLKEDSGSGKVYQSTLQGKVSLQDARAAQGLESAKGAEKKQDKGALKSAVVQQDEKAPENEAAPLEAAALQDAGKVQELEKANLFQKVLLTFKSSRFGHFVSRKADIAIMAAMTIIYLFPALINLGSTNVPKTGWMPVRTGENFTVDFGRQVNLSRIYYYQGHGEGWYIDGTYRIEYLDESGEFKPLGTFKKNDFYKWSYTRINAKTQKIRIVTEEPGGTLLELGFFEEASSKPVTGFLISDKAVDMYDEGTVENLFDEPEKIAYRPSFLTNTYFDEIYHARTAYEHLNLLEPYENTHPPLGKLFIAIGIAIFGMNPFGWRIIGTLFGAAMIPLMYLFGKKMFKKRFYGFCSAFLIMFDFMHFSQTRIATIDVYATFFIILMYYFMYDYFMNKSYELEFKKSLMPLLYCGLTFGIGVATKWISIYAGAGLALLFFSAKIIEYLDYKKYINMAQNKSRKTNKTANRKKQPAAGGKKYTDKPVPADLRWTDDFIPLNLIGTAAYCIVFFILIPIIIYIASYIPYMLSGQGHGLGEVWSLQLHAYRYHSQLEATHTFSSPWYQWPIIYRPTWFYSGMDMPAGEASTIVSMGNPAIWWVGIIAFFVSVYLSIKKKDKRMVVVFTALLFQYAPWILVTRITWIYHFFSSVPFLILSIVYVIKYIMEEYKAKYGIYVYLGVVLLLFVIFFPALSGMTVSTDYIKGLRWFKSWTF